MKQLLENPWEHLTERYPAGTIVEGRVRNLTDFGAFIEIEDGIDGLVHVSNLSWTKRVKHPSEVVKKGEKVKAVVLGVEPQNRRLSLGIKQLQPDVWESFFATHRVGDVVHGKVLRTAQFGAFVEIAEGVEGLCHISEAGDDDGGHPSSKQGQEHDFKIIKINVEEKKVGLSLRAVGQEASRATGRDYKAEHAQAARLQLHHDAWRSDQLAQERAVKDSGHVNNIGHPSGWPIYFGALANIARRCENFSVP